jgi:hypothetical protein
MSCLSFGQFFTVYWHFKRSEMTGQFQNISVRIATGNTKKKEKKGNTLHGRN